jgi:tyrosyl-tRNA synthetase
MPGFLEELAWRGLVHQQSDPALAERMREPMTLYIGFDPTAPSLHIGSLLQILALRRAQDAGHKPIAVVGGATGLIGDPSGKAEERKLLSVDDLERNVTGIGADLARFLDFGSGAGGARLVNNYDWFRDVNVLDFLRRVGKHFSVNMMLGKESVRARLEDREHGISYTEFSYMLIQSYDYLQLFERHGCKLQIGGSDQWGNITAGIDLVRRVHGAEVYGLTQPLVTDAQGRKFGKTERGAVWLDATRTSPYELYQYFMQTDDRDVGKMLRYYTFLDEHRIRELDETVARAPERREAQRILAGEVTELVHGKAERVKAEQAAGALFSADGDLSGLDEAALLALFRDAPSTEQPRAALDAGVALVELLVEAKLCASKGAARRDIGGGGIYVNNVRQTSVERAISPSDLLAHRFVVLRKGKKTYHLIRFR